MTTEELEPKTVEGSFDAQLSFDLGDTEPVPELVRISPGFPMSVAFTGAPGAGKSDVIPKFTELMNPWIEEHEEKYLHEISNPGNLIEHTYGQAMGQFGGYREDLWAAFLRFEQEQDMIKMNRSYVSNGTLLECLAHAGVNYEYTMLGQETGLITPETQQELQKIQVTMTTLTFLFLDNFRYKFAFYLPRPADIILPDQGETPQQRHGKRIEAALLEIFRNFQLRIQILDQPTNEERAQAAFDTITKIYEDGIEVPRELAPPELVL